MKETNMEHFRSEIEELLSLDDEGELFAVVNGKPQLCFHTHNCENCDLKQRKEDCSIGFLKWLMSEYKPEPVLTQREKGFVECMDEGWIARDKDEYLHWFEEKPKKGEDWWEYYCNESGYAVLKEYCFPFITWEDEKPWSVEELRKLKV